MTRIEFDDLVTKLERNYQGRQQALIYRSLALAILGYVALAVSLIVSLGIVAASCAGIILAPSIITIKLGLIFGIAAFVFARAIIFGLWVRTRPPEGIKLHPQDSPALFSMLDEISVQAGSVKFQEILLTTDMNAAVSQIPRLGIFGYYKPYLILGLPLMNALSEQEFKAVLAHEFAHLSHQHGRLGVWIYRVRAGWERVFEKLQSGGVFRPVRAFIEWFWPRFNASAFLLSRAQEYQADAFSAQVTSAACSAQALQMLELRDRWVNEHFWEALSEKVKHTDQPPADIYQQMENFLRSPMPEELHNRVLNNALSMQTGTSNTHPALKDRLAALGQQHSRISYIHSPSWRSAADSLLLPDALAAAQQEFSTKWQTDISGKWQAEHQASKQLVDEIEKAATDDTPESKWEAIVRRTKLSGLKSIQEELAAFLRQHPTHALANYYQSMRLAEEDDISAIPYFEKAKSEIAIHLQCIGQIASLYERTGQHEKIRELKQQADHFDKSVELDTRERNVISSKDTFTAHSMTPEEMEQLKTAIQNATLNSKARIKHAWLAQKPMSIFTERPHYILVLELKWPQFSFITNRQIHLFFHEIFKGLHHEATFTVYDRKSDQSHVASKIAKMKSAVLPPM